MPTAKWDLVNAQGLSTVLQLINAEPQLCKVPQHQCKQRLIGAGAKVFRNCAGLTPASN